MASFDKFVVKGNFAVCFWKNWRCFWGKTDFHSNGMIWDWSVRSRYLNQLRSNQRLFLNLGARSCCIPQFLEVQKCDFRKKLLLNSILQQQDLISNFYATIPLCFDAINKTFPNVFICFKTKRMKTAEVLKKSIWPSSATKINLISLPF